MKLYHQCIFYCLKIVLLAALEVRTPQSSVVGVYGRPVVLGCVFSSPEGQADGDLVVTWQTAGDSRVVHSFYYGKDQLDLQSSGYHNRTGLYHSELLKGNASLRLEGVDLRDEGRYVCSVSNKFGAAKAEVELKYAVFYTEPQLTIRAHSSNVTFLYESEGFPEPHIQWNSDGSDILDPETEVTNSSKHQGLYSLRTQLAVQHGRRLNYTFTLRNHLVEQVIHRPVAYVSSKSEVTQHQLLLPVLAGLILIM